MGAFGKGGSRVAMWRAGSALAGRRGQRPWEVARERAKRMSNVRDRMGLALGGMLSACALLAAAAGYASAPALAAGAAGSEGPCPNEQLRSELNSTLLPDCRAYEMVTPPFKEGYPLGLSGFAASGEKAVVYGLGSLAEVAGSGESALNATMYFDTRTANGWRLSALNPSQNEYVGQIPVFYPEASSGETLWEMHTPEQSVLRRDLYLRTEAGGFELIGPMGPFVEGDEAPSNAIDTLPYGIDHVVAATRSYDHIVLEGSSTEDRWGFDDTKGTRAGSLYEYSGIKREYPILVGVRGKEKGGSELIGECGTVLGSGPSGSVYNALSDDGEVVFFTAAPRGSDGCTGGGPESEEVYARMHGSLVSSLPAETVDVSASECSEACAVASPANAGKNFEGASENGGEVFFTSTQKLTDSAVDGTASGTAAPEQGEGCAVTEAGEGGCNLYMYDFGDPAEACAKEGKCLTTISEHGEVLGVAGMAENGARVYYVSRNPPAGKPELIGEPNLYVYDAFTGKTTFIATLSTSDDNVWRRVFDHPVEVAGEDGQFLLFASASQSLDSETNVTQLYEYDAETGELVRVTQGENGYSNDGNSVLAGVLRTTIQNTVKALGDGTDIQSAENHLNISSNGKVVVFETSGELSSRATSAAQGCSSVYEFSSEGPIDSGSVHLLSDGADTQLDKGPECGATFLRMDASGNNILLSTADPLLPTDDDGVQRDIYDARVDGGFPLHLSEPSSCASGSCEASPSIAPSLGVPGSATQSVEADMSPSPSVKAPSVSKKSTKSEYARKQKLRKLASALKECRRKPARDRGRCERLAHRRFGGARVKAKKSTTRGL